MFIGFHQIEQHLPSFEDRSNGLPADKTHKSNRGKNRLSFDARSYLYRMTGIDLTAVDGFDTLTVLKIISKIGLDMSLWPTYKHFGPWLKVKYKTI